MNGFWGRIGDKLYNFWLWCLENHPGKLFGFLIGFFTALLIIILGFWQTVLLAGLSYLGYYLGGYWDKGELPAWLSKLVHRISLSKRK